MSSLPRKVAVCAAVIIGIVTVGVVPASASTAQVEYLCTTNGSAPTPTMIGVGVTAPATSMPWEGKIVSMSVTHGTTQNPLPTGAVWARFDLLAENLNVERMEFFLTNPQLAAGQPIRYQTSAELGMPGSGVVTYRPGDITFQNSECVPRYPDSVPVLATTVVS